MLSAGDASLGGTSAPAPYHPLDETIINPTKKHLVNTANGLGTLFEVHAAKPAYGPSPHGMYRHPLYERPADTAARAAAFAAAASAAPMHLGDDLGASLAQKRLSAGGAAAPSPMLGTAGTGGLLNSSTFSGAGSGTATMSPQHHHGRPGGATTPEESVAACFSLHERRPGQVLPRLHETVLDTAEAAVQARRARLPPALAAIAKARATQAPPAPAAIARGAPTGTAGTHSAPAERVVVAVNAMTLIPTGSNATASTSGVLLDVSQQQQGAASATAAEGGARPPTPQQQIGGGPSFGASATLNPPVPDYVLASTSTIRRAAAPSPMLSNGLGFAPVVPVVPDVDPKAAGKAGGAKKPGGKPGSAAKKGAPAEPVALNVAHASAFAVSPLNLVGSTASAELHAHRAEVEEIRPAAVAPPYPLAAVERESAAAHIAAAQTAFMSLSIPRGNGGGNALIEDPIQGQRIGGTTEASVAAAAAALGIVPGAAMQGARGDRAVLRATAPVCGHSHVGESVGTLGKHYTAQDRRGESGALQDEQLQLLLQQSHVTRDVFAAAKKVRGRTATLPQGGQAALDAMASPTAPGTARSTASKKKKKAPPPDPLVLASAIAKSETMLPPNLQQIADVFRACASGTGGTLSPNDVARALELLDVADPAVAEAFINVVDVHQDRCISLEVVVSVLDTALNHPGAVKSVRDACFSLFNVDQQGYIHRPHLIELKSSPGADARAVAQKITPGMVKVLFDLFTELRRLEEEAYVLNVLCKGKKKKKLPPMPALANTYIPTTLRRIEHINADSFAQYFDKWPAIAAAFTSVWLNVALRDVVLHQNLIVRSVAAGKCKETLLQEERAAASAKAQQNEAEKK